MRTARPLQRLLRTAARSLQTLLTQRTMTTRSHYETHTAGSYESAFFYEKGPYTAYLQRLVRERLQMKPQTTLLDIGGGTGNFTKLVLEGTSAQGVVVDPFLEAGAVSDDQALTFVSQPAEAFIQTEKNNQSLDKWRSNYHHVLLKEVAHHFKDTDRVLIFKGLYNGLVPTTTDRVSLLLITRPQVEIDYPLWKEAKQVWAANQPSAQTFTTELEQAGFVNVRSTVEAYQCQIPLARWQQMIRDRFWSTFANFSDAELDQACKTIAQNEQHRIQDGMLRFEDRLVFVTATKTTNEPPLYLHLAPSGDVWTGHELFAAKHLQPDYVKSIVLSKSIDADKLVSVLADDTEMCQKIYDTNELPASLLERVRSGDLTL